MYGNGLLTGMLLMRLIHHRIRLGPERANIVFFVEVRGVTAKSAVVSTAVGKESPIFGIPGSVSELSGTSDR